MFEPQTSVNTHHEPREVSAALHPEGADEQVEDGGDEDQYGYEVVQAIQALLQGAVIQIPTACEGHTNANTDAKQEIKHIYTCPYHTICQYSRAKTPLASPSSLNTQIIHL